MRTRRRVCAAAAEVAASVNPLATTIAAVPPMDHDGTIGAAQNSKQEHSAACDRRSTDVVANSSTDRCSRPKVVGCVLARIVPHRLLMFPKAARDLKG